VSQEITSTANPRVKALARLRERRERTITGTFPIEGARVVERALAARWPINEVYVAPGLASPEALEAAAALARAGVPSTELGDEAFHRIAYREHPDGIIAIGSTGDLRLDRLRLPVAPMVLVVEAVEKPGNLGAMLRTADGAGADAVIVADPTIDPWNPNVVRTSQGALFTVPLAATGAEEVVVWLESAGIHAVAATPRPGGPAPWDIDLTGAIALVVGSEHAGLSMRWRNATATAIPMRGAGDSLNASVAAAVLLYEAVRQRG